MYRASRSSICRGAEQPLERLVSQEVDTLLGQIELHLLRRRARLALGTEHRLVALWNLRRLAHVEVAFVDEPLDDLVEQLTQLLLDLVVTLGVTRGFASKHLQRAPGSAARSP